MSVLTNDYSSKAKLSYFYWQYYARIAMLAVWNAGTQLHLWKMAYIIIVVLVHYIGGCNPQDIKDDLIHVFTNLDEV